jgi:putative aldouronate transport system permease protein
MPRNVIRTSVQRKIFNVFNITFLSFSAMLCLFPVINIFAISLSSSYPASAGKVSVLPVGLTLSSYKYVLQNTAFWRAFLVTLERLGLAVPLTMIVITITAYPMSKNSSEFKGRKFYTYFLLIPMLFDGGLIPSYMTLMRYGMIDKIWVLVLPGLTPVFSIILLMNFIRDLPEELEEAACIDGAPALTILFRIILPLSTPAIATVMLFCMVGHWNSWFDGILYMNNPKHYPLQSFLQTVIVTYDVRKVSSKDLELLKVISDKTTRAAQIFVGTFPILITYPFLQKYFTKGLVMGSVKG